MTEGVFILGVTVLFMSAMAVTALLVECLAGQLGCPLDRLMKRWRERRDRRGRLYE